MRTRKIVSCGVMAGVTCALAPLSISVGPVPLSLATLAVMMSGVILGGRLGALSQLVYLLVGIAGLPVCAGWTPALPRLIGPTGGYLIGYIPLAFICGAVYSRWGRGESGARRYIAAAAGMLAGTAALYAIGTAWFCVVGNVGVVEALAVCVLPFLPGDAAKIAAVTMIAPRVEKLIMRN